MRVANQPRRVRITVIGHATIRKPLVGQAVPDGPLLQVRLRLTDSSFFKRPIVAVRRSLTYALVDGVV
jgi:hypothetical protein